MTDWNEEMRKARTPWRRLKRRWLRAPRWLRVLLFGTCRECGVSLYRGEAKRGICGLCEAGGGPGGPRP